MTNKAVRRKIISFILVGIIGAICDYGLRYILLKSGIYPFSARGSSYIFGSVVAYYLNSFFTFHGTRSTQEKTRALLTYAACFLTAVLFDFLVRNLFPSLPYVMTISWIVSQGVATFLNFSIQNLWVFSSAKNANISTDV